MNIALITRWDHEAAPGGDIDQTRAIGDALRKQGHAASLVNEGQLDPRGFDLAILFNLTRPEDAWRQAKTCLNAGVPYAVFPVYWDHEATIPPEAYLNPRLRRAVRALPAALRDGLVSLRHRLSDRKASAYKPALPLPWLYARRRLNVFTLVHAKCICVMSDMEIAHLRRVFPEIRAQPRFCLAPNGIWSDALPDLNHANRVRRVVSAGAFGPRKNQLNLIRAARGLDAEVLLLGYASAGEKAYEARMKREAPANVRFIERQDRAAYLDILNASQVYAQPSYFELPGIAALEGAALGCRMVLVDAGSVRDYFKDDAHYIDPGRPDSIRAGLRHALAEPVPHPCLPQRIRTQYNWETCLVPFAREIEEVMRAPGV